MKENSQQAESVPRCDCCGCGTREGLTTVAFWMDDGLTVIEDVLAQICEGCGEQFLDEETTERIQELLKTPTIEPRRKIRVPVYNLSRLESMAKHRRLQPSTSKDAEAHLLCRYCQSQTVEGLVKSAFWVNEQLIAVEDISARVCQSCNVQFYDDETAEAIATLAKVRAVPDAARHDATVSVFSLSDREKTVDNRFYQDASARFSEG